MAGDEEVSQRDRVRAIVRDQPGSRPSDVAEELGLHPSTADYHLRRLEAAGLVVRVQAGRELHHYLHGAGWCEGAREVHARLTPAGRALVELVLDEGHVSRRALVSRGFSRSATRWAIERMREAGVIERTGWGLYERGSVSPSCALAALRERPCASCNDPDQVTRATSSPSPSGRTVASKLE